MADAGKVLKELEVRWRDAKANGDPGISISFKLATNLKRIIRAALTTTTQTGSGREGGK